MENSYQELVDNIIYVEEEPNLSNSTYTFIDFGENVGAADESEVIIPHSLPKHEIVEKNYICGSCDHSFVHRKELDAHLQTKHPQIYNIVSSYRKNETKKEEIIEEVVPPTPKVVIIESCFTCKCGEKFRKFLELEQHVEMEHSDEFQAVPETVDDENPLDGFEYCEEDLSESNDLIEEDPVVAEDSITSFVTIDELISKRVSGVKGTKTVRGSHICTYCGEKFCLKSHFLDHMRDKHPDNPEYLCEICSKGFFDQLQLKKHRNIHNLKRFVCDICSKGKEFHFKNSILTIRCFYRILH